MTKPSSHLLHQIQQRALVLKVMGATDRAALKQAAAEAAAQAKAAGAAEPHPRSASSLSKPHAELMEVFTRWIHHIWHRPRRKTKRIIPTGVSPAEPCIIDAPVVVYEPAPPLTADAKLAKTFPSPLVISDFSRARIIPDNEFPARYHDQTTANWRNSLRQAQELAEHRARMSAAYRNRAGGSRYVG
jgi:hypothetical protein